MPFFDRGSKDKQPDPLERLRQYTTPPPGPPPAPAQSEAPPVAVAPPSTPPPGVTSLDALVDEAVSSGDGEDVRAHQTPPSSGTPPLPTQADNAVATMTAPQAAAPSATAGDFETTLAGAQPTTASGSPSVAIKPGEKFFPRRPTTVEETGLSRVFLSEHVVRTVYFAGEITGTGVAEAVGLPFPGVLDGQIEALRRENVLDVKGQRGIGEGGYVLALTDKGATRAHEALAKVQYRGPAPVPLDTYIGAIRAQTNRNVVVTEDNIRDAFSDLLIRDSILDEVGPAVNSGSSMFLFGYPGNGKTSIAERITRLMGDSIYIPFAVETDGAIIKLFDTVLHEPVDAPEGGARVGMDRRWVEIRRPTVVVGGELTMAGLDLLYNEIGGYYEAPLQMKANGGMFLIDDFGRQLVRPTDLLNRWIVPLEKRIDFLTLITGKKLSIPFEELIVFSTNLDPTELVDDAFLRRIKFKINVLDPDADQFKAIFQMMARSRNVEFDETGFNYLLEQHYRPTGRPLRMCQPRDILDQLIAIAKYKMREPKMTPELLDMAAGTYFVTMSRN